MTDAWPPFTLRQQLRSEPGGGKPFARFLAYEVSGGPARSSRSLSRSTLLGLETWHPLTLNVYACRDSCNS